jgi:hypothetical protein
MSGLFGFRVPSPFIPTTFLPSPDLADCPRCGWQPFDVLPGGESKFGPVPDMAVCRSCCEIVWDHFPEPEQEAS